MNKLGQYYTNPYKWQEREPQRDQRDQRDQCATHLPEEAKEDEGFLVVEKVKSLVETAKAVKGSVCGTAALVALRNSITENIAECTGQMAAEQIGPALAELTTRMSTCVRVPLFSGILTGVVGIAKSLSSGQIDYQDLAKKGAIAAAVGGCAFIGAPFIAGACASLNIPMSAAVVEITATILGGFIASKIHGTEEQLFNFDDPLDSYFVKSLQAMGCSKLFDMLTPTPVHPVACALKFGAKIAVEALGFNAKAIATVAYNTLSGKLLSQLLPNDEQIAKCLNSYLAGFVKNPLDPSQSTVWQNMCTDALPILLTFGQKPLEGKNDVVSSIRDFLTKTLKDSKPNVAIVEKAITRATKNGTQFALASFKAYFTYLEQDPLVVAAQEQFDSIYEQFANEKDPEKAGIGSSIAFKNKIL